MAEQFGIRVLRLLAREGSLRLTLPDRTGLTIGFGEPFADLQINDYSILGPVTRRGLTGFAEGYMDGLLDTTDLERLIQWGAANQRSWFDHPVSRMTYPVRKFFQKIIPERRHRKVRSMNDHYNLGNSFYETWLDETMTYSSARFATPDQSLADAQRHKYETIADLVRLEPGMRVLEIGCGWGGFAEYAASERGCDVIGITLSEEQAGYAADRISRAGLADKVQILVQDFRDVQGEFDAVVSIEMIESVDETQWGDLFESISGHLGSNGLAAMQVITIADSEWERYRSRADFIQQYIFPGGQLPAPAVLEDLAASTGLEVEKVDTFGRDYARTLEAWHTRFHEAWSDLAAEHQLDDRFRRMWDLYLLLCAAGFKMGRINVEQWGFSPSATQSVV